MSFLNIFKKQGKNIHHPTASTYSIDCEENLVHKLEEDKLEEADKSEEVRMSKRLVFNRGGVDSFALALSAGESLFYDIFFAGEYWEIENQHNNYGYEDITEEITKQFPEFMINKFSQLCDAFLQLRENDSVDHNGSAAEIIQTAGMIYDYENIIPGLSFYEDFINIILSLPNDLSSKMIALPHRKKIIKFRDISTEEFIKSYRESKKKNIN